MRKILYVALAFVSFSCSVGLGAMLAVDTQSVPQGFNVLVSHYEQCIEALLLRSISEKGPKHLIVSHEDALVIKEVVPLIIGASVTSSTEWCIYFQPKKALTPAEFGECFKALVTHGRIGWHFRTFDYRDIPWALFKLHVGPISGTERSKEQWYCFETEKNMGKDISQNKISFIGACLKRLKLDEEIVIEYTYGDNGNKGLCLRIKDGSLKKAREYFNLPAVPQEQ